MFAQYFPSKRLFLLFLCQAFFWSIVIVGVAFSGLIGLQLAPYQTMATVPMATLTIGNIMATLPLSIFMQRYGRKAGFMLGAIAMIVGGLLSIYAIKESQFLWFCLGNIFLGFGQASAFYYRFAAADNLAFEKRGRALAWVLAGGIVAALIAPSLGIATKDLFLPYEYVGAFMVVTILGGLTFIAMWFFPQEDLPKAQQIASGRTTSEIIRQPVFLLSILNTATANSVMILIMVATPLAILACGFSVADSTSVIQWHVLGMFLPAFFSGQLIDKLGVKKVALVGCGLLIVSGVIAIAGIELVNFYSALFLLGVGWNFLYLSGSTLLTAAHTPEERGRIQGLAEISVAILAAFAAFGSGVLLNLWGWTAINSVVVGLLIVTFIVNYALRHKV